MISPLDALPDDPATLKAIILTQRAEAERMAASVRAYEALIRPYTMILRSSVLPLPELPEM